MKAGRRRELVRRFFPRDRKGTLAGLAVASHELPARHPHINTLSDCLHNCIHRAERHSLHDTIFLRMANALEGCVASLRSSMQLLDSSISILDSGVNDFPRLAKVLQTTRVRDDQQ